MRLENQPNHQADNEECRYHDWRHEKIVPGTIRFFHLKLLSQAEGKPDAAD
jgi:hypothetical protein